MATPLLLLSAHQKTIPYILFNLLTVTLGISIALLNLTENKSRRGTKIQIFQRIKPLKKKGGLGLLLFWKPKKKKTYVMTYFTESILFLWVVFWWFILCYFGVVYGGGGFSKYWRSPWCFWFFCVIVTSKSNCRRGETSLCSHATAICINAAQFSSFQRDNNLWPIDTAIKSSYIKLDQNTHNYLFFYDSD